MKIKKKYHAPILYFGIVLIAIGLFALFYFNILNTALGNFFVTGGIAYENGDIRIEFANDAYPRSLNLGDCASVLWQGDCRNGMTGSSAYLKNVRDEAECNSLNGTWTIQSSAQGCQSNACFVGNFDFSNYTIRSANLTTGLTFDLSALKTDKVIVICNNHVNGTTITSVNEKILLSKNYIAPVIENKSTYYRLINNNCTNIQLYKNETTSNDYLNLSSCTANVIVNNNTNITTNNTNITLIKKTYYRLANNASCTTILLYESEKTINDYILETDCNKSIIINNTIPNVTIDKIQCWVPKNIVQQAVLAETSACTNITLLGKQCVNSYYDKDACESQNTPNLIEELWNKYGLYAIIVSTLLGILSSIYFILKTKKII